MYNVSFSRLAWEQFNEFQKTDKNIYNKIVKLIDEIIRTPYTGTGKPEPLKHDFTGYFSRRINTEHRIIYIVKKNEILIVSVRGHYEK